MDAHVLLKQAFLRLDCPLDQQHIVFFHQPAWREHIAQDRSSFDTHQNASMDSRGDSDIVFGNYQAIPVLFIDLANLRGTGDGEDIGIRRRALVGRMQLGLTLLRSWLRVGMLRLSFRFCFVAFNL